ncbi:wax ester/triacylglycerol synthase family O-acyltransferase [Halieaceae bacterium IMCC14734]|uniref:diacylglycerol O-acyltransferase n=1 Tax=Candidatus Litorirhabdus singularis TaxID=2518993 RepID=A0ABT3TBN0_9GAMM|nr:wax ester/triacylglycerol synthase family O-acyltransferase [Candidatus Litorirhabdus singularis]MCX2979689.1 wax ester/triacylglycerol synthase family O-acyltransferase [Candidatus Litorirhabdus singularis]
MRRIDLADAGFLYAERRETPMHVGGVNLYTLPPGVSEREFVEALEIGSISAGEMRAPFGEFVATGRAGPLGPLSWELDQNFDVDYHVRHSALPRPGRYRELFELVSRLHSTLLDRSRPLWEMHLIEGLSKRQFAVYMKMHHAAIDGVGSMQLTQGICSPDPDFYTNDLPMSQSAYDRFLGSIPNKPSRRVVPKDQELRNVAEALKQQFDTSTHLFSALRRFGGAFFGRSGNLAVPWHNVPATSINTKVTGGRRFVAQSWEFARIKAVCKAMDGTVNDIVLAMCSGALRRYLESRNELPEHSLKAMAPVSLRDKNDYGAGNAVGFITADLATNIANPEHRVRAIQKSMAAGKELLKGMTPREASIFFQLTQVPALLTSILGLAAQFPAFSTVISNVPGPREQLYWNGARLDGIYPASIIIDGFAMNITLVSYHQSLDFGIVACRRSLPQIQRMIDHLEDALTELEDVAGLAKPVRKRRSNSVSKKATTGSKPKASAAKKRGKSRGKTA